MLVPSLVPSLRREPLGVENPHAVMTRVPGTLTLH
jgi:hypothetical protein